MESIVIRIGTDGEVLALSGSGAEEVLDLRTFGIMTVTRASNVRFDAETQTWDWRSVDGKHSGRGFPTRLAAIADEIEKLSAIL